MTPSHAAHEQDRATFGGWRAQRPFWGGLFLILSGLELFLSGNLKLALEVHFGPTGYLSYVLPLIVALCGLLSWFTPQQRLFYGILGTVTALYSLIGLNLGGFFLGTVLGLVGGGLVCAWSPAPAAPAEFVPPPPPEEPYFEDSRLDDILAEEPGLPPDRDFAADRPTSGVLTDELPTTQVSPLRAYDDVRHDYEGHGAGSADEERPPAGGPGELPKRRHLGPLLMAGLVAVSVAGLTAQTGKAAYAAPAACPSSTPAKSGAATAPAPAATPTTAAPPAASPTPTPTQTEKPGLLDWLGNLITGGDKDKTAAPEPTQAPAAAGSATTAAPAASTAAPKTSATKSSACTSPGASPTPNNKKAQIAAGQPFVAKAPSILKADVMTMDGLTYDGVADLPRKDGTTVKVLAFSMKNSVSTPFELDTPGAAKNLVTKSSKLTVEGNVKFYTTKFSANVLGLLPLTFTPSFPPPPIPLPGFYTDCNIELVYVQSNVLTAPNLNIAYAN